jgi:hypothetical protein
VWHASAAPLAGWQPDKHFLRRCALDALKGVGNSDLGQWEEWSGFAYHVRRRLTGDEQALTGDAVDVRGTPEQERIYQEMKPYLPVGMRGYKG